jgi:hypothetical protein
MTAERELTVQRMCHTRDVHKLATAKIRIALNLSSSTTDVWIT